MSSINNFNNNICIVGGKNDHNSYGNADHYRNEFNEISCQLETDPGKIIVLYQENDTPCKNTPIKDLKLLIPVPEVIYHVDIEYMDGGSIDNNEIKVELCSNEEITVDYIRNLYADQLLSVSIISKRTLFQNVAFDPELIKALQEKLKFLINSGSISADDVMACLLYEHNESTVFTEAAPYEGSLMAFAELILDLNLLDTVENRIYMRTFLIKNISFFAGSGSSNKEAEYCINKLNDIAIKLGLFEAAFLP